MGKSSTTGRNFRLLTVALRKCTPPLEPAMLAALPGFDWIGDAPDCNEGLRLTLMIRPDVIIVPACEAAPKLLPVLAHLRRRGAAPLAVAVVPETRPDEFPPQDGVVMIGMNQLDDGLAERLRRLDTDSELELRLPVR